MMAADDNASDFDTVGVAQLTLSQSLDHAGIPDSRIEARVMVADATGLSRTDLLVNPGREIGLEDQTILRDWLTRRLNHEPLPYIVGWQEFYGRRFSVNRTVLIPRGETEALVEQTLAFIGERGIESPVIADIGCGSGALAVTLACELPTARVIAVDISSGALEVAKENADLNGVPNRIDFRLGDLLAPLGSDQCDVIVCNPPYVLSGFLDGPDSQSELVFEPRSALDGGEDGMMVLRRLISALPGSLKPHDSAAYIEFDPPVADACLALAIEKFPGASCAILNDLAGLERCLAIELNGE